MNIFPINQIYSSFKNLKFEKQFLFIFDETNLLIKKIPLSSTKEEKSGLTLFENLSILSEYKGDFKFFIVHNHPSSTPEPSHADYENMFLISYFFEFFNLNINDYLIVSELGFFSFLKHNLLPKNSFEDNIEKIENKNIRLKNIQPFNINSINSLIKNDLNEFEDCLFVFSKEKIYIFFNFNFDDLIYLFNLYEPFVFFNKNAKFNISYLLKLLKPIHFFEYPL